jgi:oligoribonuclease NrnB/cAMP/cGMP phosphodiesterase (DHH superfamily)
MALTQITHHDLDGYGAATVAAAFADPGRIVHVSRYSDVGPVVDNELKRLGRARTPETLLITDIGLEDPTVVFLRRFAAMNRTRAADAQHRLIVLDHHASSIEQLRRHDLAPEVEAQPTTLLRFDLGDPNLTVLIDEGCCATRMTYEHRALFATRDIEADRREDLQVLIKAVQALDLWRKADPAFAGGLALDEVFWDNVANVVPIGHPWHDHFVSDLLLAVAALLRADAAPAEVERRAVTLRAEIVDKLLRDEPDDDPHLTTRMRIARALARSDTLFRELSDKTLLSFGLDAGTFQRVSDLVMASGRARRLVNVQRSGSLSFRSIDGTALDGARLFGGGGHRDAAGGRLPNGATHSIVAAATQVEAGLNPPQPNPADSPFAALKNWKG